MIVLAKILIFAMGFSLGVIYGIHITYKKVNEILKENEHDGE